MTTYDIERENERPGVPPTSVWVALQSEDDSERAVVALVGLFEIVKQFGKALILRGGVCPIHRIEITPPIGVFFAGSWPAEKAKNIAQTLQVSPSATMRDRAKVYLSLRRDEDRRRIAAALEPLSREIATIYVMEILRSRGDGV